jgi:iron complex transport system substrate-binding protein
VEIATAFGTTVVDAAPERVVVVGYSEGDTVLALGTVPVAVQEFSYPGRPGGPWIDSLLQGRTPTVLTGTQLNYEQIASLTPDLIIGISRALTDQDYAALSAIAPTLARPAEYPDFGVPVDVQARMVGQALGKSAEVDALLSDVQDQIDAARTDHPEFQGTTYSAVWPRAGGQGWFAWTPIDVRSQFMTALGLQLSDSITALGQENFYVEISAENTAQIDADVIVVIDVEAQRSTLEADPVFTALPAVQAGHVAWVTGTDLIAAFNYGSVLSLPFALQGIVPILQEAVAA